MEEVEKPCFFSDYLEETLTFATTFPIWFFSFVGLVCTERQVMFLHYEQMNRSAWSAFCILFFVYVYHVLSLSPSR